MNVFTRQPNIIKTPVNKPDNVNANYLKIPKKHLRPHKTTSRATCRQRV